MKYSRGGTSGVSRSTGPLLEISEGLVGSERVFVLERVDGGAGGWV
jgi:hypothetical protein